jgi:hypothetical protein
MYAKIHASLWDGSLCGTGVTWAVFVFLCAKADLDGSVDIHPRAIATQTGFPEEEVRAALIKLESADPESRSDAAGGARIERIDAHRDWGWMIVNYMHYRTLLDKDTVRQQTRERVRKHREAHGNASSRSVTHGNAQKRHADGEVEAEEEEEKEKHLSPTATSWRSQFEKFWKAYPHVRGRSHRKPALALWDRISPKTGATFEEIMAGLEACRASPDWQRDSGQFVEAAERWLRRSGWDVSEGDSNTSKCALDMSLEELEEATGRNDLR